MTTFNPDQKNEDMVQRLPEGEYTIAITKGYVDFEDEGNNEYSNYYCKLSFAIVESDDPEILGAKDGAFFYLVDKQGELKSFAVDSFIDFLQKAELIGDGYSISSPQKLSDSMMYELPKNSFDVVCIYMAIKCRHTQAKNGKIYINIDFLHKVETNDKMDELFKQHVEVDTAPF